MKHIPIPFFQFYIIASLFFVTQAKSEEAIVVEKTPTSTEEFNTLRDKLAQTPEGAVVMFILAMQGYVDDKNTGTEWLTIALDRSKLQPSGKGYKGFTPHSSWDYFLDKLAQNPHWPLSYIDGTEPLKHYKTQVPYKFILTRNKYSILAEDRIKVFINCSGAATPRPVTVQKNNRGIWKVLEASTLFVGMKPPGPGLDDEL